MVDKHKVGDLLYRAYITRYAPAYDDIYGDDPPRYSGSFAAQYTEYVIESVTPKGYWYLQKGLPREYRLWRRKGGNYAWTTKSDALEDLCKRWGRRESILINQLSEARRIVAYLEAQCG